MAKNVFWEVTVTFDHWIQLMLEFKLRFVPYFKEISQGVLDILHSQEYDRQMDNSKT